MIKESQEKFLRKVAKESLKNAEKFVSDAEVLFKRKSYGHAFALAVLGEEELAKAIMHSNAVDGTIGVKGKWRRDLSNHKMKQTIALSVASMYEVALMVEEAEDFAEEKAEGDDKRFKQIFEKKFQQILEEEEKMFDRKKGDIFEHLEPFRDLQKKREKAMYVEANLKEQRISSPRQFKKSTAKRYISHVKERLEVLKHGIGGRGSPKDKKIGRAFMKMVLSSVEGEQKRKLLEWYGVTEKDLED